MPLDQKSTERVCQRILAIELVGPKRSEPPRCAVQGVGDLRSHRWAGSETRAQHTREVRRRVPPTLPERQTEGLHARSPAAPLTTRPLPAAVMPGSVKRSSNSNFVPRLACIPATWLKRTGRRHLTRSPISKARSSWGKLMSQASTCRPSAWRAVTWTGRAPLWQLWERLSSCSAWHFSALLPLAVLFASLVARAATANDYWNWLAEWAACLALLSWRMHTTRADRTGDTRDRSPDIHHWRALRSGRQIRPTVFGDRARSRIAPAERETSDSEQYPGDRGTRCGVALSIGIACPPKARWITNAVT